MQEKVLSKDTLGRNVKDSEETIQGYNLIRAKELADRMAKGEKLPFKKLLYCNIGNPLSLGQPAFSFNREVLSCVLNPSLLTSTKISKDAKERAKSFLECVDYPHGIGAYSDSMGFELVRNSVKSYIEERDNCPSCINNIFLTDGATDGVRTIFSILFSGDNEGVLL